MTNRIFNLETYKTKINNPYIKEFSKSIFNI